VPIRNSIQEKEQPEEIAEDIKQELERSRSLGHRLENPRKLSSELPRAVIKTSDRRAGYAEVTRFDFKSQREIHVNSVMTPAPALSPQPLEELRKPFLRPLVGQLQKLLDDLAVAAWSPAIPVYRSPQAHRRAGAPFSQSMLAP
jgi:hypothetical protein